MLRVLGCVIGVAAMTGCMSDHTSLPDPEAHAPKLSSGIETQYEDPSVRPQDDLYRYLNGKWLDEFVIPADKGSYTAFTVVDDRTQEQLHSIVDALAQGSAAGSAKDSAAGSAQDGGGAGAADAQKLADLYASFMDEARLETLGLSPLMPTLAAIDALATKKQIPALIAQFNRTGIGAPYDCAVAPDPKDSSRYAVSIHQSGLGLPDRDYYLKDDAKLKEARDKYAVHVESMLRMAGDAHAHESALGILKLESAMAERQWTRVENRDPIKTYNKIALIDLPKLMPDYDWQPYLADSRIGGKVDYVIVEQPSYLSGLDKLIADTPLPVWRNYFKWHALAAAAPYLSKAFVDERFAFAGTVLRGIPQNRPRWKRGVGLLDGSMGEALGRLYVEKYFPPQNKARMQALVRNLLEAYVRDIDTLDWMSAETQQGRASQAHQARHENRLPRQVARLQCTAHCRGMICGETWCGPRCSTISATSISSANRSIAANGS